MKHTWRFPLLRLNTFRAVWFRNMMTSSNGNIFRVTSPLCVEFIGHRWIPRTKASDAELWCFLCLWMNGWVSNRDAGDLRRHRAHYDVTVMKHEYAFRSCWWHGDATNLNISRGRIGKICPTLLCIHIAVYKWNMRKIIYVGVRSFADSDVFLYVQMSEFVLGHKFGYYRSSKN